MSSKANLKSSMCGFQRNNSFDKDNWAPTRNVNIWHLHKQAMLLQVLPLFLLKSREKRGSADAGSDDHGEESSVSAKKRKLSTRRAEQNRAAQRAFRERKEKHTKELEEKVLLLETQYKTTVRPETEATVTSVTAASDYGYSQLEMCERELLASKELGRKLQQERDQLILTVDQLHADIKLLNNENQRLRNTPSGSQGYHRHSMPHHGSGHMQGPRKHYIHGGGVYHHNTSRGDPRAARQYSQSSDMQHFTVKGGAGFVPVRPIQRPAVGLSRPLLEWSPLDASRVEQSRLPPFTYGTSMPHMAPYIGSSGDLLSAPPLNSESDMYFQLSQPLWLPDVSGSIDANAPKRSQASTLDLMDFRLASTPKSSPFPTWTEPAGIPARTILPPVPQSTSSPDQQVMPPSNDNAQRLSHKDCHWNEIPTQSAMPKLISSRQSTLSSADMRRISSSSTLGVANGTIPASSP
ncbi:hypothetical protein BASA60_008126 [Batrachochytrium salamandrivorans]|nr:hypothetical protein BASA60_008126 [Batrachochytrium salamandrivorans]